MLKKFIHISLVLVVLFVLTSTVYAHPPITVYFNGEKMEFDSEPIIVNDRTLVPVRFIVERLGATVDWDNDTRTVTIAYEDKIIKLQINNEVAYVDGKEYKLDSVPIIRNDRTLVPLRFLSENFGCLVEWDGVNYNVYITRAEVNVVKDKDEILKGDTFDVIINLEEVYDLYSYQLEGTFDSTKLEIIKITPTDYIDGMIFKNTFDNEKGRFILIKTLLGKVPGVTKKGELARITFRAKETGNTKLDFGNKGIMLVNSNIKIIPLSINNEEIIIK